MEASECKCVNCGKQAVAFWPCMMDIPSHPYCRECLDKEKTELFKKLCEIDEEFKANGNNRTITGRD